MGFDAVTDGVRPQCALMLSNSMWSVTGCITILFSIVGSVLKGNLNALVIVQLFLCDGFFLTLQFLQTWSHAFIHNSFVES